MTHDPARALEALIHKSQENLDKYTDAAAIKQQESGLRSEIAMLFVKAFFLLIVFSIVVSMSYNAWLIINCHVPFVCEDRFVDVKEMVVSTIGYISAPLGFVIGYYFKSKSGD